MNDHTIVQINTTPKSCQRLIVTKRLHSPKTIKNATIVTTPVAANANRIFIIFSFLLTGAIFYTAPLLLLFIDFFFFQTIVLVVEVLQPHHIPLYIKPSLSPQIGCTTFSMFLCDVICPPRRVQPVYCTTVF